MTTSEWSIFAVNEVRDWIFALDPATKERVVQAIDVLAETGPSLGRPLVDSITHSSIATSRNYGQALCASCLSSTRGVPASCW